MIEIIPQPKQFAFLSTAADVAFYGGAAGAGKSWSLLAETLRHKDNPKFGATIFRETRPQITNEGGLWDESFGMFPAFRAVPNLTDLTWTFPHPNANSRLPGASVGFSGLQYDKDAYNWQGSQIALLGFDELTHFSEFRFFYMLSRNRSMSSVIPYVRATCNADAESWVADFLEWYIDQNEYEPGTRRRNPNFGLPIPERGGRVRYFARDNNKTFWGNSYLEVAEQLPHLAAKFPDPRHWIKSFAFFPALVFDNPALLETNPTYLANLLSLPLVERERLLNGNWKIKATAGKVFNREWFKISEDLETGGIDVRFFDFAATEKALKKTSRKNDPDYTATVKLRYKKAIDRWTFTDAFQIQAAPANVEKLFFQTVAMDVADAARRGVRYKVRWEIEPGSAALRESYRLTTLLPNVDAKGIPSRIDKVSRARNMSRQAEIGNVYFLKGVWNSELLLNLHGFPDLDHDDLTDAATGAFNEAINDDDFAMSD